jgi:Cdc6-like AAA superfamily ATPase
VLRKEYPEIQPGERQIEFIKHLPIENFTGRDDHLKQLKSILLTGARNEMNSYPRIGIYGPSGIGKSSLVRQFYKIIMDENFRKTLRDPRNERVAVIHRIWLNAASPTQLKNSICSLASHIGLKWNDSTYSPNLLNDCLEKITAGYDSSTVVILTFDQVMNKDEQAEVVDLLMKVDTRRVFTICTSIDIVALQAEEDKEVTLKELEDHEAIALVKTKLGSTESDVDMEELCAKLGNDPFFLQTAISTIKRRQKGTSSYRISNFLVEYESNPETRSALMNEELLKLLDQHKKVTCLLHTFDVAFERLSKESIGLLKIFAWFEARRGVDRDWLRNLKGVKELGEEGVEPKDPSWIMKQLHRIIRALMPSVDRNEKAMRELKRYSLLEEKEWDRINKVYIYRMTRLLQCVCRAKFKDDEEIIVAVILENFKPDEATGRVKFLNRLESLDDLLLTAAKFDEVVKKHQVTLRAIIEDPFITYITPETKTKVKDRLMNMNIKPYYLDHPTLTRSNSNKKPNSMYIHV